MTLDSTFCEDKKFEGFSEDDCSVSCLKPCEELFYSTFFYKTNYEAKNIIYIHKIYMTFVYFMSSIGGLLGLWNNVSFYDLQLLFIKICGKIFNSKLMRKLSKILKTLDFITIFVTKVNIRVKTIFLKILFQIYITINIIVIKF
jgi:hypothetical protein